MIGNQVQRPRSIATDECIKAVLSGQVSLFEFFLCDIRRIKVRPQGFFSHAFDKGPVVIQTIPRTIVDPDIFLYGTGLTGSFIVECVEQAVPPAVSFIPRSEEHTSELQSLMRISYAVFYLKKKNT